MYFEGAGVERNLYKAKEIFELFADKNELCRQSLELVKEEILLEEKEKKLNKNNNSDNNNSTTHDTTVSK